MLHDFRRVDVVVGAAPRPATGHAHALFQRHHHDAFDASVQALDTGASNHTLGGDAGALALGLIVPMAGSCDRLGVHVPDGVLHWPAAASQRIRSCDPDRLERPPRG